MRLSICIPTHHGRQQLLEEALESIAVQVGAGLDAEIEIAVSDNASTDGTEAMIAAFTARHPAVEVVYTRNDRDVRLANIFRVVERASGDWCWLFGSDDRMAGDALTTIVDTIRAHPDATGIAVARTNFDHSMRHRVGADPPETAPTWHETTVIHGFAEIEDALAFQHGFLGTNLVQRELWLAAAADTAPDAIARHPDWPQLVVFAEMARRRPTWVWLPAVLVLVRSGRPYLVEADGDRPNLARMHVLLVDGLRRAWREIAAGDDVLNRALMERTFHVAASRHAVENIKLSRGHGLAWDLRLARSFVRGFWWFSPLWRELIWLLLVPAPAYRALRLVRQRALGPMPVLAPDACSVTISAELPARWWAREMPRISCRVRNTGPVALRTVGAHPIQVGGRWYDQDGELLLETLRVPLPCSVEAGEEVAVILPTHTPWDPGRCRLELGCVQENVRWLSDADPLNALVVDVDVELAGAPPPEPARL